MNMLLRALVVDDDQNVRELITELLTSWGYEVQTAENGEEAMCHLREQAVGLVVTDYHMPGMNGVELARNIRLLDTSNANARIIMISGDFMQVVADAARRAGVDDFLQKPFKIGILRMAINRAGQDF